jgi:hypothetical protein
MFVVEDVQYECVTCNTDFPNEREISKHLRLNKVGVCTLCPLLVEQQKKPKKNIHPEKETCEPCAHCGKPDADIVYINTGRNRSLQGYVKWLGEHHTLTGEDCICLSCDVKLRTEWKEYRRAIYVGS